MIKAGNILLGAGIAVGCLAGCYLDSEGSEMYIAGAVVMAGLAVTAIGSLLSIMAEVRKERTRRWKRETEIKRDRVFQHWVGYDLRADLADYHPAHRINSKCP